MAVINVTEGAERFTANAFLVPGSVTTLVDVGTPPWVVEAIGERVDELDAVVVTHAHADHIEQLDAVREAFDPEVYMFADDPRRSVAMAEGDHVPIGDDTFEVVHTPGHADDHVSLVGERALFSGDVVVYNDAAFDDGSFGRTDYPDQSREMLIDSIESLLERLPASVSRMYPGHGDPYVGDVQAVVERVLERASRREPKYPEE